MGSDMDEATPAWAWDGLVTLTSLLLLVFIYLRSRRHLRHLPPGPPAVPLVGSAPFLGKDILQGLANMGRKYGEVFTVAMPRPTVVLHGYRAIREAYVKQGHAFTGRPQDMLTAQILTKGYGIVLAQGDFWVKQRKFSHRVLRDFGMGRNQLEASIHNEIHALLASLRMRENTPHDPSWDLMTATSNVISAMTYSMHHDYDDMTFRRFLISISRDLNSAIGPGSILSIIPFLRYIPGDLFGYSSFRRAMDSVFAFIRGHVKQHMDTYNPDEMRDFADAFIAEMKKEKAAGHSDTTFSEEQLTHIIVELFVAGSETTGTTLRWGLVFMACYPDVQARLQAEIQDTVGWERLPSMQDRPAMPYTEAAVLEMQRRSISSLSIPRETTEDVTVLGHRIPAGTQVLANIHAAHMDPEVWPDPDTFDPTRFLDADGNVDNREKMISFSMGKRVCLGESLARMELFLIFTAILQRFTISVPPGQPPPSLQGEFNGIVITPPPFQLIFKSRQ